MLLVGGAGMYTQLALHVNTSMSLLQINVLTDPNKKKLSNGRNALHIACRASADAEIMSLLIER